MKDKRKKTFKICLFIVMFSVICAVSVFAADAYTDYVFANNSFANNIFANNIFPDDVFANNIFPDDASASDVFAGDVFASDVFEVATQVQLEQALSNAAAGDTIIINANINNISSSIVIDKAVTIKGAEGITPTLNFKLAGDSCISIQSSGVTIENLKVTTNAATVVDSIIHIKENLSDLNMNIVTITVSIANLIGITGDCTNLTLDNTTISVTGTDAIGINSDSASDISYINYAGNKFAFTVTGSGAIGIVDGNGGIFNRLHISVNGANSNAAPAVGIKNTSSSNMTFNNIRVTVTNTNAIAIYAPSNSNVTISNDSFITVAANAIGIDSPDYSLFLEGVTFTVSGANAIGIKLPVRTTFIDTVTFAVSGAGATGVIETNSINYNSVTINVSGIGATGIDSTDSSSVNYNGITAFTVTGAGAIGVFDNSDRAVFDGLNLSISSNKTDNINPAIGIKRGASPIFTTVINSNISAASTVQTGIAIQVPAGDLSIKNSTVIIGNAVCMGIDAPGTVPITIRDNSLVKVTGAGATGLRIPELSITFDNATVEANGAGSIGILDSRNNVSYDNGLTVKATGAKSIGVQTANSLNILTLDATKIETAGADSVGIYVANDLDSLTIKNNSTLTIGGARAVGIKAENKTIDSVTITESTLTSAGAGAKCLFIDEITGALLIKSNSISITGSYNSDNSTTPATIRLCTAIEIAETRIAELSENIINLNGTRTQGIVINEVTASFTGNDNKIYLNSDTGSGISIAISISNANMSTFTNETIESSVTSRGCIGIQLGEGSKDAQFKDCTFNLSSTLSSGANIGINIKGVNGLTVTDCKVNLIDGAGMKGLQLEDDTSIAGIDNTDVTIDNMPINIYGRADGASGIYIGSASNVTIQRVTGDNSCDNYVNSDSAVIRISASGAYTVEDITIQNSSFHVGGIHGFGISASGTSVKDSFGEIVADGFIKEFNVINNTFIVDNVPGNPGLKDDPNTLFNENGTKFFDSNNLNSNMNVGLSSTRILGANVSYNTVTVTGIYAKGLTIGVGNSQEVYNNTITGRDNAYLGISSDGNTQATTLPDYADDYSDIFENTFEGSFTMGLFVQSNGNTINNNYFNGETSTPVIYTGAQIYMLSGAAAIITENDFAPAITANTPVITLTKSNIAEISNNKFRFSTVPDDTNEVLVALGYSKNDISEYYINDIGDNDNVIVIGGVDVTPSERTEETETERPYKYILFLADEPDTSSTNPPTTNTTVTDPPTTEPPTSNTPSSSVQSSEADTTASTTTTETTTSATTTSETTTTADTTTSETTTSATTTSTTETTVSTDETTTETTEITVTESETTETTVTISSETTTSATITTSGENPDIVETTRSVSPPSSIPQLNEIPPENIVYPKQLPEEYTAVMYDDEMMIIYDEFGVPLGYLIIPKGMNIDEIDIMNELIPFSHLPVTGGLAVVPVMILGGTLVVIGSILYSGSKKKKKSYNRY